MKKTWHTVTAHSHFPQQSGRGAPDRQQDQQQDQQRLLWGVRRRGEQHFRLGFVRGEMPPARVNMTLKELGRWLHSLLPPQHKKP